MNDKYWMLLHCGSCRLVIIVRVELKDWTDLLDMTNRATASISYTFGIYMILDEKSLTRRILRESEVILHRRRPYFVLEP